MRDRIHHPNHRGPLHPGAKLGDRPTDKIERIIRAAKCPEHIQFADFFHWEWNLTKSKNMSKKSANQKSPPNGGMPVVYYNSRLSNAGCKGACPGTTFVQNIDTAHGHRNKGDTVSQMWKHSEARGAARRLQMPELRYRIFPGQWNCQLQHAPASTFG